MNPNIANLSFQEQDVIELLIFGNNTENGISKELLLGGAEVSRSLLWNLRKMGLVRKASGMCWDMPSSWQYCGGPVSEFFKSRQQTLQESETYRLRRSN